MVNVVVSFSENILRLTLSDDTGLHTVSRRISDPTKLSEQFDSGLQELSHIKRKNIDLTFLIEPTKTDFLFVTVDKTVENVDHYIVDEIKKKLKVNSLETYHFSYQKIAPFVYQVVVVKKDDLKSYLDLASTLEIPLRSVVPWVLALPKFLNSNSPAIFVTKLNGNQVVALADLNGIYFSASYDNDTSSSEIESLIQQLSVYKRSKPISTIYTVKTVDYDFGDGYKLSPLLTLTDDYAEAQGFELHLLIEELLSHKPELLDTQLNLLTLLPVPETVRVSRSPAVYAGGVAMGMLLLVGGFSAFNNSNLLSSDNSEVLSEQVEDVVTTPETIESASEVTSNGESQEEVVLNREDLILRIENGAGIEGIAGKTRDFMQTKGYTVSEIGNAAVSGNEKTIIQVKASTADYSELLSADLSELYDVEVATDLDESATYDALIVVGLN